MFYRGQIIEALEDFITAALLSDHKIEKTNSGRIIHFTLANYSNDNWKLNTFYDFLNQHQLQFAIEFDVFSCKGYIKPSLNTEKILQTWTNENNIEVQNINPENIRPSAIFLYIALFGKKMANTDYISVPTSLGPKQQRTVSVLIDGLFGVRVKSGENQMYITSMAPIIINAFIKNAGLVECLELINLSSVKEKQIMQTAIRKLWKGELTNYAT